MITPLYTSWFPVVRLETLMSQALDGRIRWPDSGWPDSGRDFLGNVRQALHQMGDPDAFLPPAALVAQPTLERVVVKVSRYGAIDDDVPPQLLAFQLDVLAKLCIAEELKQQVPLLLCGSVIEELRLLTGRLGGPTAQCRDATSATSLIGTCAGLLRMGLLSPGTAIAGSDAIVNLGAPIAYALQQLLIRTRAQLEPDADKPMLGLKELTLRAVLAEHYGMALSDFD
jgi:hypothetical protein